MFSILSTAANAIFPRGASTVAAELDWLFYFILWVSVIFTVLIFAVTIYLAWRYRYKPGGPEVGSGPTHSNFLEIFWSVIPGILVLLMAIWGFQSYLKLSVLPQGEVTEIQVEGYKWGWRFTYPNGFSDGNQLHVVKDQNVRIVQTSNDVIHSLYFPHFRLKKDVVPGRYNKFWFNATEESPLDTTKYSRSDPNSYDPEKGGDKNAGFDIFCAEYCGTSHSKMLGKIHVHPDQASFDEWMKLASDPFRLGSDGKPPKTTEIGSGVARKNGCLACHSLDGSAGSGPTWKNLYMHKGKFTTGEAYVADENYIRESILYPQKHLVSGYGASMGSYLGKISDREITALIQYLKSISDNYDGPKDVLDAPTTDPKKEAVPVAVAK